MKHGSVLVVGGGIGGLATAIALRDKGFDVKVIEIQPDLHSSVYGVGIIQPVNALRALEAIDCAGACLEHGFAAAAWARMLDIDGNVIGNVPGARYPDSDLPPMNGITRPKLHEILTGKALGAGATVEYSKTFTELSQTPAGVAVSYSDGSKDTVEIVVGADGVDSRVREHILGPGVQPVYNGQSAFRCNLPRVIPGEIEIDRITLQRSPQGMAGYVPIGKELAYLFFNTPWDRDRRLDKAERVTVLRDCLASFRGLTATVRDNYITDPDQIVVRPQDWLIVPPPWHRGRVVLIGDAVHSMPPTLGQGAAQAIEDGIVLADCLASSDNTEAAFTQYTDRRYERCKLVVEASVQIGRWQAEGADEKDGVALRQRVIEEMLRPI